MINRGERLSPRRERKARRRVRSHLRRSHSGVRENIPRTVASTGRPASRRAIHLWLLCFFAFVFVGGSLAAFSFIAACTYDYMRP